MTRLPLAGLRVLEVADGVAGPYCGKLLGDLGAQVVKVDARPEDSGLYLYLNAGKRIGILEDHADWADVLVDDGAPRGMALRSDCVRVSVTPFGLWGPHATWQANALIAFHSSGFAHGFPSTQVDDPALPPLTAPGDAGDFLAGQIAACAAMHGLLARQQTGRGSHIDVSLQEAIAAENHSQFNAFQRTGTAKRTFSHVPTNATVALLPCADGWLAISPREEHQWSRWLDVMGGPAWAADPRFADRGARERNWAALYPLLAEWTRTRGKQELFEAAQARRVACYPLGTAADLVGSPQLAARDFFETRSHPRLGELVVPGRPYKLAEPAVSEATPPARPVSVATDALRPLEGVRVVDFSWVMTGPICTRYLAALGADVIKIESAARPDLSPRDLSWQELNPGKRSATLNLKDARGRELARQLVAHADLVVENFSSGVMERLGLDYPRLSQINPRLIMASSSALGRTGPERDRVAYGTLIQCFTGWATLAAHPGYPPRSAAGIWTDPLTAVFELLLVLAAIWRQRATGQGCFFDLSMAETTIAALPEPILEWSLHHTVSQPRGNRSPAGAPQGCYPALGDDRWVALSIRSNTEWATLCELMQRPELLADAQLADAAGRRDNHDALDAAIARWTAQYPAEETAACLQARGIAATPTLEPGDVVVDPHLVARGFPGAIERLEGGLHPSLGVPWLIDRARPSVGHRPPRLGQDNAYVFGEILGLGEAEIASLVEQQVIF
ncbi:MAG TPA: CoA transferase [Chloroflexota bacterium]|nr:CoA transferase [Chloroflexota bacterium]